MAAGFAEILLLGLLTDWLFRRLRLPGLVGMLCLGLLLGPYVLNTIEPSFLEASSDLRMIALIVILLRAGFELTLDTLRKVGWRAGLLSCVPAIFEGAAIAILGSVMAAVSPAVVVPQMIDFARRKMGARKGIPTFVIAASSIDDVFVIVIFSVLIGLYTGARVSLLRTLGGIPVSIGTGILVGTAAGWVLYRLFDRFNPRATKRLLFILGVSVALVTVAPAIEGHVPFAALLAVMAMGAVILEKNEYMAHEISSKLNKVWVFAEILLFTLVGAQVNVSVAMEAGLAGSLLIVLALVARSVGTYACLLGSDFTPGERFLVVISYLPKATVQAAIGGAPLLAMQAAGMPTGPGQVILAVAVLSILLTAPLGAWAIARVGNRVLKPEADVADTERAQGPTVAEVMSSDPPVVSETRPLGAVFEAFSTNEMDICAVVKAHGALAGIVRLDDLRPLITHPDSWQMLLTHDAAQPLSEAPRPDTPLDAALRMMQQQQRLRQIPVVRGVDALVVGLLDAEKAERYHREQVLEQTRAPKR